MGKLVAKYGGMDIDLPYYDLYEGEEIVDWFHVRRSQTPTEALLCHAKRVVAEMQRRKKEGEILSEEEWILYHRQEKILNGEHVEIEEKS